jgi:hypothetical protein
MNPRDFPEGCTCLWDWDSPYGTGYLCWIDVVDKECPLHGDEGAALE